MKYTFEFTSGKKLSYVVNEETLSVDLNTPYSTNVSGAFSTSGTVSYSIFSPSYSANSVSNATTDLTVEDFTSIKLEVFGSDGSVLQEVEVDLTS